MPVERQEEIVYLANGDVHVENKEAAWDGGQHDVVVKIILEKWCQETQVQQARLFKSTLILSHSHLEGRCLTVMPPIDRVALLMSINSTTLSRGLGTF